MDLESAQPKLKADVTLHALPEGGGVVRQWQSGTYLELDPDEFFVAQLLDGQTSLAQINRKLFDRCGELHISMLLHLVARMQEAGVIHQLDAKLASTQEPVNPALRLLQLCSRQTLAMRLAQARGATEEKKALLWVLSALLLLPAAGLFSAAPQVDIDAFQLNGSYALALLFFGLALSASLSVRQFVTAWALYGFGARPWQAGLAVTYLVPHFWIDERDIAVAGRRGKAALAAFRLAVPVMLSGAAAYALQAEPQPHWKILQAAWGFHLLMAACPFLPQSDISHLLAALASAEKKWARSRTYLFERLLQRTLAFRRAFLSEPLFVVSVIAYALWFYAAFLGLSHLARERLFALLADVLLNGDNLGAQITVTVILGCYAFAAALLVAVPVYGLLKAATRWVPAWHRQLSNQRRQPAINDSETWRGLGEIALFAHLAESQLRELADKVKLETFHAGERIFQQNDSGDRFYSIRKGQVEILRKDETSFTRSLAVLGAGDSFGEIALLEGSPRTASIRSISQTECYSLSREGFQGFIAHLGLEGAEITEFLRLSQFLRGIKLFRNLGPDETVRILQRAEKRKVAAGDVIIHEGDDGNDFFLIRQGEFSVTVNTQEVARLKAGEYFGEVALLMNTKRTARVSSVREGELLMLSRAYFYDTVASNFQLGLGLEAVTRERRAQSQFIAAKV